MTAYIDGKKAQFDAVILATGDRPRISTFLTGISTRIYDENGAPLSSAYETEIPALYFCRYYVAPTGMLREIGLKARSIARKGSENAVIR